MAPGTLRRAHDDGRRFQKMVEVKPRAHDDDRRRRRARRGGAAGTDDDRRVPAVVCPALPRTQRSGLRMWKPPSMFDKSGKCLEQICVFG